MPCSPRSYVLPAAVLLLLLALATTAPATSEPLPPFVSTDRLASSLSDPSILLLDARPSLRDYLDGHIPGAAPLAPDSLRSVAGGMPGKIFPQPVLEVVAGRIGLRPDSSVVVYGSGADSDASYVASVLKLAGASRVAILDGGFERWKAEARPVTRECPAVAETKPTLHPDTKGVATLEDVRRAWESKSAVLLDARPPEQFDAGRIPGAASRFWKLDLVPEGAPGAGLLKPPAEIEKEYAALGIVRTTPVIVYCNTGHQASSVYYNLRFLLGFPDVRLYNGSFVEWSASPARPVEKGPFTLAADRARKAADSLTSALLGRLQAELKEGGPASAVLVCSVAAPEIAREHSTSGTSVRRVSLKARNLADVPDDWERERLVALESDLAAGKSLPKEIVEKAGSGGRKELRFLRPILIGPPCLACHGDRSAMAPEVRAILDEQYPGDPATGYRVGDLRGAVSVRIPLE